jgi:hypothetical protein
VTEQRPAPERAPDGGGAGSWLSPAAYDALRLAVVQFKATERRRVFDPVLHAGRPGGRNVDFVDEGGLDQALRTDVCAALLSRARLFMERPVLWLTRPGLPVLHDLDQQWFAAARAAYGEASLPLAIVIVTRAGWYNPRTGERREWKRLRQRT